MFDKLLDTIVSISIFLAKKFPFLFNVLLIISEKIYLQIRKVVKLIRKIKKLIIEYAPEIFVATGIVVVITFLYLMYAFCAYYI